MQVGRVKLAYLLQLLPIGNVQPFALQCDVAVLSLTPGQVQHVKDEGKADDVVRSRMRERPMMWSVSNLSSTACSKSSTVETVVGPAPPTAPLRAYPVASSPLQLMQIRHGFASGFVRLFKAALFPCSPHIGQVPVPRQQRFHPLGLEPPATTPMPAWSGPFLFPEQAAESLSRWAYVEVAPPDPGQRRRLYLMITDAALGAVRLRVP
jgi:hypothetical protein